MLPTNNELDYLFLLENSQGKVDLDEICKTLSWLFVLELKEDSFLELKKDISKLIKNRNTSYPNMMFFRATELILTDYAEDLPHGFEQRANELRERMFHLKIEKTH